MKQIITVLAALIIAACGASDTDGAVSVQVGNAFIVEPAPGRDMTMAGMDIAISGQNVRLVGVHGNIAETIEIHTMSMSNGTMQMRQIEGIDIPAGETARLQRGGDHLMMFGVDTIAPGEAYELDLIFETENGERLVIDASAMGRAFGHDNH